MERLKSIVKETRKQRNAICDRMVEDYIKKASLVLKAYLKVPGKEGNTSFFIEISDIDYKREEVKLGGIWNLSVEAALGSGFREVEKVKNEWLLKSEMDPEEVKPFLEALRRRGFKKVLTFKSEGVSGQLGLCPVFEVPYDD